MADFAWSSNPHVQAQLDRLSKLSPAGDRLGLERIAHCSTASAVRRTAFRRCSTSPGRTAKARSAPSFERRSKPPATRSMSSPARIWFASTSESGLRVGSSRTTAGRAARRGARRRLGDRAELFRGRDRARASRLRPNPGRRLHSRGRSGWPARCDQHVEQPAVCEIAGLGIDHQSFLGDDLRSHAKKPGSPSAAFLWSLDYTRRRRRGGRRSRGERVRIATRGRRGCERRTTASAISRPARRGRVPLPALEGPHQGSPIALALAMLSHQTAARDPLAALGRMACRPTGRRDSSSLRRTAGRRARRLG